MSAVEFLIMDIFTALGLRRFWYRVIYRNSTHWQTTRRARLRKSRYTCDICGKKTRLDVHHLTYERIGRERMSDLQALCRFHHRLEHRRHA